MADEENKGYRVEDRRFIFREGEEAKAGERKAEDKAADKAPETAAHPEGAAPEEPRPREERRGPLPPVTFATFIFSLNSSALIHLGEMPDPATGQAERDLELAKQTIDLLGMLKEKTRGNLASDEEQMLDAILFDLRMRYLKLAG